MPQRYSRYAYGPNEEDLQNLGGPFFNPYSKRGDVGYALRQAVNMLLAKKREEQDTAKTQAKEDWERKFKEAEFGLRERQVAVQERPEIQKPPNEPDDLTKAKYLMEKNPQRYPPDNPDSINMALQDLANMQHPVQPKEPRAPSAFEQKRGYAEQLLKLGMINQDQFIKSILGIAEEQQPGMARELQYMVDSGIASDIPSAYEKRFPKTKTTQEMFAEMIGFGGNKGGGDEGRVGSLPPGTPAGSKLIETLPDGTMRIRYPDGIIHKRKKV